MLLSIVLAAAIGFKLAEPARVSIVVERTDGTRVRNLIADQEFTAGAHSVEWDERDDNGKGVTPGEYRWRGITHSELRATYCGSFYSPGSTPWKQHTRPGGWNISPSGSGGWLSDHEAPWCVFTDESNVYLGCRMAEAGDAIIKCDLDGNKVWGQMWLGLSGANAMCTEGDVLYVAGEGGWQGERLGVNLYNIKDYQWVMPPKEITARHIQHDSAWVREASSNFCGIAGMYLTPQHIVLALNDKRRLAFFDRKTGLHDHDEPLKNARSLALKPSTKLMRGMATDAEGNIYRCATNAAEQCIKVFAPNGKLVRTIGKPGGRTEGKFNPLAMSNPVDVAVDARGLIWVCENSFYPKRVSVWTRDGKLVRDYIGTPFYGGGGSLIGHTAYYSGMRFKFNNDFSAATLDALLLIPAAHTNLPVTLKKEGPSDVMEWRGRRYLIDDDGPCKTYTFIGEEVGDNLVPRVIVGSEGRGTYIWQNGVKTALPNLAYGSEWALRIGPQMEIVMRTLDKKSLAILKPCAGTELRYDPSQIEFIKLPEEFTPVCSLAMTSDSAAFIINRGGCGNQGSGDNIFGAISRDGKILWTYPNPYPSNTHNSPMPHRGELRHTLGIEGFANAAHSKLMLLNGNKGTRYLFTTDGIFVQELFGDMRDSSGSTQNFSAAQRGMNLAAKSLSDECFGGWMGNVGSQVYLIEGKDSLNVCKLDGTQSIKPLQGGSLRVTQTASANSAQSQAVPKQIRAVRAGGFGLADGWWRLAQNTAREGNFCFALGVLNSALRLWINVDDATPFENAATDLNTIFHYGDAIDLRWEGDVQADKHRTTAAARDLRFVIAPTPNGIAVMRYTFVDKDATSVPVEFASPVSTYKVARVEQLTNIKPVVTRRTGGYSLTIDLPWQSALGESDAPQARTLRRADVGVIFGDATGSRTIRRSYFFDPASQEVSDIPSETRVNPSAWGTVEF